jgi:hypothetical protein
MFSSFYGMGGHSFFDEGPNRDGWSEKSEAAIRREKQAMALFDKFLEDSKTLSSFPVTEVVVPPAVHLTGPCWQTFKRYVMKKGCTTKRREATRQEKLDSKDKRSSKLYVISVTVPVHPAQAMAALKEEQDKTAAAALKKRQTEEREALEERELQAKIKVEYSAIVASLSVLNEPSNGTSSSSSQEENLKKRKIEETVPLIDESSSNVTITVPRQHMLAHADSMHRSSIREITAQVQADKALEREQVLKTLNLKWQSKEEELVQEAARHVARIKDSIVLKTNTSTED